MKRIIIVGATSLIAQHCAKIWLTNPVELILVARNVGRIRLIADDLKIRSPKSKIQALTIDFTSESEINALASNLSMTPVDILLIAHGALPTQEDCSSDLKLCRDTLYINGISPCIFAEAFALHMQQKNRGTIAIISSVAGDRGRKSNYVYGSAKSMVSCYTQGLQHRMHGTDVNIILIKPGPTLTPMTAGLQGSRKGIASPFNVALDIVRGVEKNKTIIYTPIKWSLIMSIIKHIPDFLFNKMNI